MIKIVFFLKNNLKKYEEDNFLLSFEAGCTLPGKTMPLRKFSDPNRHYNPTLIT